MKTRLLALIMALLMLCAAFSVASAQTSSFLFVGWGDSRSDGSDPSIVVNKTVLSGLSNQALAFSPAFTLFTGDLCTSLDTTCISSGSSGWQYAINGGVGDGGNGMSEMTFATRGNHDTGPEDWQTYFNMGTIAQNLGTTITNQLVASETYSFDYKNSHFVSVDVAGDINLITATEINWLDADLTAAEKNGVTHTFLFWHGPIYCVDGHCHYRKKRGSAAPSALISVINKHPSIIASFHGHEHVNAYTHLDGTRIRGLTHPFEQFVVGGAGAPLENCDKAQRYDYCYADFGFVTVVVDLNDGSVTVSQYLNTGGPVEQRTFPNAP